MFYIHDGGFTFGLRPIGRRIEGHDAARHAFGGGARPSRVCAVGRRSDADSWPAGIPRQAAAFDRHVIGITPDYVVEVRRDVQVTVIRKIKAGQYRLYSRKKDTKLGR
jgi:hypothetical protein